MCHKFENRATDSIFFFFFFSKLSAFSNVWAAGKINSVNFLIFFPGKKKKEKKKTSRAFNFPR